MSNETSTVIRYQGNQISFFSDDRADYLNLTEIANALHGNRKSIKSWLKNQQTLNFLRVWEQKHNPNFKVEGINRVLDKAKDTGTSLSIKYYIEETGAIGIFTKSLGGDTGTYAHRDIALKFAGYLSPELELHIIEELQRLKKIEQQKNSFELLSHEQILFLVRLKEVFKYVAHQTIIEDAHKEVFASRSGSKNPFADFNAWRNKVLDITPDVINDRIKQYCIENNIALSSKLLNKSKRDKILMLDSYDAVRNAVWDFLSIEGAVNALNLANLVRDIIRTEKGEVLHANETDLFHQKQDLGTFSNFAEEVGNMKLVKTARDVLKLRESIKNKSKQVPAFDQQLKGLLGVPPPKRDK